MEPTNIRAFKDLVKKYETITLEEIKKHKNVYSEDPLAKQVLGIGSVTTCSLCKVAYDWGGRFNSNNHCIRCVYGSEGSTACAKGENAKTYFNMREATTPKRLLKAFHSRAKYLRKTYPQFLKSIK